MKILGILMTIPFMWFGISLLLCTVFGVDLDDEVELREFSKLGGIITLFIYGLLFIFGDF